MLHDPCLAGFLLRIIAFPRPEIVLPLTVCSSVTGVGWALGNVQEYRVLARASIPLMGMAEVLQASAKPFRNGVAHR